MGAERARVQSTRDRRTETESEGGRRRVERAQQRGELKGHRIRGYARRRREELARKKKGRKHKASRATTVGAGMTARAVARHGKCV